MSLEITREYHARGQNAVKDIERDCSCGCKGKCGGKTKSRNYDLGATLVLPNTYCPDVLAPVCGKNDNSYKNICYLNRVGVEKAYDGWCQKDIAKGLVNPSPMPTVNPTPQPCPTTVAPVCSIDNMTYENECLAKSAGKTIKYQGACIGTTSPGSTEIACPMIYDPVCSTDLVNFGNECMLKAAGKTLKQKGLCPIVPDVQYVPPSTTLPPTTGGGILDSLPQFSQTTWLLIAAGAFLLFSSGGGGRKR